MQKCDLPGAEGGSDVIVQGVEYRFNRSVDDLVRLVNQALQNKLIGQQSGR